MEQFYGPQNFHPNTTYDDLRATKSVDSTSPFVENQSLYWVSNYVPLKITKIIVLNVKITLLISYSSVLFHTIYNFLVHSIQVFMRLLKVQMGEKLTLVLLN